MSGKIVVKNAIMLFPSIFEMKEPMIPTQGKAKYTAKFLLHKQKNEETIKKLLDFEEHIIKSSLGGQEKIGFKNRFLMDGQLALDKNGNVKEKYADYYMFNASNTQRKPKVYHENAVNHLERAEDIPAGSLVNIQIEVYVYNSKEFGRRSCATLRLLQRVWYNDGTDDEINKLIYDDVEDDGLTAFGVINNGITNAPRVMSPFQTETEINYYEEMNNRY